MAACIKLAATHGIPQGQILFYRGLISLAIIYAYLRWRGLPLATPHWKVHLSRSVVGYVSMVAFFGAISRLPLGTAVTLIYLSPLVLGSMLLVIHRERPHPVLMFSLLGGLCGVVLLLRPSYDSSQLIGIVLGLIAAVASASSALNIRSLSDLQEPSWRVVLYFTVLSPSPRYPGLSPAIQAPSTLQVCCTCWVPASWPPSVKCFTPWLISAAPLYWLPCSAIRK
jgi:drug/metabolite transporter (DMT)-like permease